MFIPAVRRFCRDMTNPWSKLSIAMVCAASVLAGSATAHAQAGVAPVDAQEAREIGVRAYLYLYPLVTMDITRRQMTNVVRPEGLAAPANVFVNVATYPAADMKIVVRPNFDTLYSSAWLDLRKEPMIVSAPDTGGRYYMLPMLDMWTDVFASPGSRTTGTQAHSWALVAPDWEGALPQGVDRIEAPTPFVWIIGRTKTDGPADYDAVHKIQDGYRITPLSRWGKAAEPIVGVIDPTVGMKTTPKDKVDSMAVGDFLKYAAEVLKSQPAHLTDQPIVAMMKRIGLEPGKPFDIDKLDPAVKQGLSTAQQDAQKLMQAKFSSLGRIVNNWTLNVDTMGVYGNYYLKRAIIAQRGLGANLPDDAVYPMNLGDSKGEPLNGANRYTIHFDKGATPPARAFWSITLYDQQGYQVANPLNRFAVSSWMPLKYNADGSLDLYFQSDSPGADKEANWLPAPKGPFNLTMRLYAPKPDVVLGQWAPAPVVKAEK
jgi:hypothetical protein